MGEKQRMAGNRVTLITPRITNRASGVKFTRVPISVRGRMALAAVLVVLSASCSLDDRPPPPPPDPNPRLALSPISLDFGQVPVDVPTTQNVTLKNSGGTVLLVSSAQITGEGFTLDETETVFPANLSPGETVLLKVTLTPLVLGTHTGSITFTSDATNSPTLLPLAGEAFQARTVGLAWDPSASEVNGYYLYRSTSSGGPYTRVNLSIVTETSFIDISALADQNYFYVVTAVAAEGVESILSNEAAAPAPETGDPD